MFHVKHPGAAKRSGLFARSDNVSAAHRAWGAGESAQPRLGHGVRASLRSRSY